MNGDTSKYVKTRRSVALTKGMMNLTLLNNNSVQTICSLLAKNTVSLGGNLMGTQSLTQLTERIENEYAGLRSLVLPTQAITLTEDGLLHTGKNRFVLTREASKQLARLLRIPPHFYLTLEPDLRAIFFNRRFQIRAAEADLGQDIRITLNNDYHIIGYDNPKLLRINPLALMEAVNSTLPKGVSAEHVRVSRSYLTTNLLSFSCFSPEIVTEPRVGDIINGGIDVHHSATGGFATQVRCYLRRLVCENGATTHICADEKHLRARRLSNGKFDEKDMLDQIQHLFTQAWAQIDSKLQAVKGLLEKEKASTDFLRQERARFSLNNRLIREIENALDTDEIGPTGRQYDFFNAISRIASHNGSLSLRQQRRLMFMAGEFSQQDVHRCPQCGSWVVQPN
jgi:hypothetical protein